MTQKQPDYEAEFWSLSKEDVISTRKISFKFTNKYNKDMFYAVPDRQNKIDDPLKFVVSKISEKKIGKNLICIYGEQGTGKTTLIQNIAAQCWKNKYKIIHLNAKTLSSLCFEYNFVQTLSSKESDKYVFVIDDPDPLTNCSLYDYYTEGIFSNLGSDFVFLVSIPKHVFYLPRPGRALSRLTLSLLPANVAASLANRPDIRREMTLAKIFENED